MPFEAAVHVVDCFFYDGARVVFMVALAILDANKDTLESELVTLIVVYRNTPRSQWSLDPYTLSYNPSI